MCRSFLDRQKCVTLEAEYVDMADGAKEALYVRGVWIFLMLSLGSPSIGVFEDNQGAIDLAQNLVSSSNSKHIDVSLPARVDGEGKLVG